MGLINFFENMPAKIVFITGTDTGVGKTLLTALLLQYLRQKGVCALAMKPFSCGSRADAELLHRLQNGDVTLDEINPIHFPEPVAPLVAGRIHQRSISLKQIRERILTLSNRCRWLLIEGIGGLCVPLTERHLVIDLIKELDCETIVVSWNRLGTLNHTLSAVKLLQHAGIQRITVGLMTHEPSDFSVGTNGKILAELLKPTQVIPVRFLGREACTSAAVKKNAKKIKITLAKFLL